jgi:hypothetical protein
LQFQNKPSLAVLIANVQPLAQAPSRPAVLKPKDRTMHANIHRLVFEAFRTFCKCALAGAGGCMRRPRARARRRRSALRPPGRGDPDPDPDGARRLPLYLTKQAPARAIKHYLLSVMLAHHQHMHAYLITDDTRYLENTANKMLDEAGRPDFSTRFRRWCWQRRS